MEKGAGKKAVVWSKAVSNEAFLAELQTLLSKASDKGSAFVTMKQVRDGEENACLVRVRYQEHKSSTLVHGKELVRFQTRLAAVTKRFVVCLLFMVVLFCFVVVVVVFCVIHCCLLLFMIVFYSLAVVFFSL
jgi:hypothetical protein